MKFWKRVRYYLIGLGIGTVITIMIFGARGCNWLPENRVLEDIANSTILISHKTQCFLACKNISEEAIYEMFSEQTGDVLFDESEPRKSPKIYIIESEDKRFKLEVWIKDSVSTIRSVKGVNLSGCSCNELSDSTYITFSKPVSKIKASLFYTENKEVRYNEKASCKINCFGLTRDEIAGAIDGKAKFMKALSKMDDAPPIYVFRVEIDGVNYDLYFEDAGKRTRLVTIRRPGEFCDCP